MAEKTIDNNSSSSNEEEKEIAAYKVILLGDSGVGKTSIVSQYFEKTFNENHITTIGVDFRYKSIEVDGTVIRLQVWDTAGQERFRAISRNYYRGADAVIIVYDVTSLASLQGVCKWLSEIDGNSSSSSSSSSKKDVSKPEEESQPILYLVGNKADLADKRCIEEERGREEAEVYGARFMETSAKDALNIEELFMGVAWEIKNTAQAKMEMPENVDLDSKKPKKGCC